MKLSYKATTQDGKVVQGMIEAKDKTEAATYLRSKQMLPIQISSGESKDILAPFAFLKRSNTADLVLFTRQLSSILTAGLTLMQALGILREQMQKTSMHEIVGEIISDVEEGKTLSDALRRYPNTFSPVYISLIKAGESSGVMDKILLRLADNLEKDQKLKATIRSALLYPVIVIILMVVVMGVMMIFVVPQLTGLYTNLGVPLPLPTQIVITISNVMTKYWFYVIIGFFGGSFVLRRWLKTEAGQVTKDNIVLKIPVFGRLIEQTVLTEFSRTFGLLIGAGTLVVQALHQSADVAGNRLYKHAILDISQRVEKGVTVGDAMSAYTIFPPILVQMVRIGEETGKMDDALMRVSEYFEREVEEKVKTLTTAMEPFIMVILGIGVAFLIVSIITPIYNLTSSLK